MILSEGGLRDRLATYWSDLFNRLDLPAMLLAIAAVVAAHLEEEEDLPDASLNLPGDGNSASGWTPPLRAYAALLLWARMLRVLLLFPSLGPYTLMIFVMLNDMFFFLLIESMFVFMLAAAMYVLAEHYRSVDADTLAAQPECIASQATFLDSLRFMFEASVTAQPFL